jgi:hypothetical protein
MIQMLVRLTTVLSWAKQDPEYIQNNPISVQEVIDDARRLFESSVEMNEHPTTPMNDPPWILEDEFH